MPVEAKAIARIQPDTESAQLLSSDHGEQLKFRVRLHIQAVKSWYVNTNEYCEKDIEEVQHRI